MMMRRSLDEVRLRIECSHSSVGINPAFVVADGVSESIHDGCSDFQEGLASGGAELVE